MAAVKMRNNCGWSTQTVICSKCGTTIEGDWLKGVNTGCFVATAAFDNQDHPTVEQLRNIRDEQLAKSKAGNAFIKIYYRHGPALAMIVNRFPLVKPALRTVLTVLVKIFSNDKNSKV